MYAVLNPQIKEVSIIIKCYISTLIQLVGYNKAFESIADDLEFLVHINNKISNKYNLKICAELNLGQLICFFVRIVMILIILVSIKQVMSSLISISSVINA